MRRSTSLRGLVLVGLLALGGTALAKDGVAHYKERVAAFEAENKTLDPKARHVVLVGDSLTEGWTASRVKRFLPTVGPSVLNRGISSDGVGVNARGVLNRLDASILDCHATHAFLLIGVNDLGRDGSGVEGAAKAYDRLVRRVRESAPRLHLVAITLAPAAKGYKDMNPGIVKFNDRVRAIAAATSTSVIDLHAKLVDAAGALPEALTTDGLHWTDGVYETLGAEIERAARSR